MKIDDIEKEIEQFSKLYFENEQNLLDQNKVFIKTKGFIEPTENYIILFKFINLLLSQVSNIDKSILNATITKLHQDINILHSVLLALKNKLLNLEQLFLQQVIPRSKIFQVLETQTKYYDALENKSNEQYIKLQNSRKHLKIFYNLYFQIFHEKFYKIHLSYTIEISKMFNTKIFYLDKILWLHLKDSKPFLQKLHILYHHTILNSRSYIIYKMDTLSHYSAEYQYLAQCLKVFK